MYLIINLLPEFLHRNLAGDVIAMGSENGCIYLFRVTRDGFNYKRQSKIRGTQPLQHLDWSVDGFFLQTVTVDCDLLFCECFARWTFQVHWRQFDHFLFSLFIFFFFFVIHFQGTHVLYHLNVVQY